MKSIICKIFSDVCVIKYIKYEMKSRYLINSEKYWKIKNKEMYMENSFIWRIFSL